MLVKKKITSDIFLSKFSLVEALAAILAITRAPSMWTANPAPSSSPNLSQYNRESNENKTKFIGLYCNLQIRK